MSSLETALRSLAAFLEEKGIPYMTIGGVAGLAWGVRRATFDVDVTVWAAGREEELVEVLCGRFQPRAVEPASFARETGVLPLQVEGVPCDIILGRLPYEESAIRRARRVDLEGSGIRICSPEDWIVHKIVSERVKDVSDIREIMRLRGGELDRGYLDPIIRGLSEDMHKPEIWKNYVDGFPASGK